MKRLAGKIAIVTGASSGIGHAAARLFASEGAQVVVSARRQNELDALVEAIVRDGGSAVAVAGDVCDKHLAQRLVTTALERFGGLDIAFNNAGIVGPMGPLQDMSPHDWHDIIHTNLTAAFVSAKYQVPALLQRGGGSLLFTSSFVGHTVGMPGMAAYGASKAGILGMMKCLAAELGPHGIRVNALLPGGTDTPASITNAPDAGPEVLAFVENLHALKRMATPEEIARAALYLASDDASFVTGTAMLADGGVSINRT
ncbi:MAG: SDR family oxidoreductase [Halomonas sp.]|jgi:NAD(P)-dependent dehydrogenase (short-subunit alcohol dehydrogenase family)|uniref:Glucose 1-dehydrogenase n=1 Tax=Billgrantia tianxiuensis TaxID=2497861 RepID=A0A6I6SEK5_9GAMM|nr:MULTISPECIES: SDR family oxidoreductase [Halomonas]MCE8033316.1 SDR family oxidoreductase [Halomonas sp. MCCC 1A11057]MDX5432196.1 SDR family oxidoreductase [Halomonas sp.]QHC49048.1 glucose 1-dehydrogenase [Halomonas tianxiuensis]